MTVITANATDTGTTGDRWSVPQDNTLNQSPIPRGTREYSGTIAVDALGANDETSVNITMTFPTPFIYLVKNINIEFRSDDLTSEFSNIGILEYRRPARAFFEFGMLSDGQAFRVGVNSQQNYRPTGNYRLFIQGPLNDTLVMRLCDASNDTSTAGDILWQASFWEYDIEQCLSWPVNTPNPVVGY